MILKQGRERNALFIKMCKGKEGWWPSKIRNHLLQGRDIADKLGILISPDPPHHQEREAKGKHCEAPDFIHCYLVSPLQAHVKCRRI